MREQLADTLISAMRPEQRIQGKICWTHNSWKLGDNKLILFEAPTFMVNLLCNRNKAGWYVQSNMEGILSGSMTLLLLFSCKSCLTPCDPMFYGAQGFPVLNTFQSFVKLMSIEAVRPSNHLILCSPFSSYPQSFPASRSFPMSQLFPSGGQSIGVSASASVLPMNIQDWFPLGWTGWISLQSKELSRVFSNTTVQKHQFVSTQPSLWSNCHIQTWLLQKYSFDCIDLCQQSDVSAF